MIIPVGKSLLNSLLTLLNSNVLRMSPPQMLDCVGSEASERLQMFISSLPWHGMRGAEMSALKTLRSGFIYLFVVMAMLIVATVMPTTFTHVSSMVVSMAIFVAVLLLSIAVLFLYAFFGKACASYQR
jgi:hypothetical protein